VHYRARISSWSLILVQLEAVSILCTLDSFIDLSKVINEWMVRSCCSILQDTCLILITLTSVVYLHALLAYTSDRGGCKPTCKITEFLWEFYFFRLELPGMINTFHISHEYPFTIYHFT
jgi:hypothetical protein